MEPFLVSVFLDQPGDQNRQLCLSARQLVMIYKGKSQIFDIEKVLHVGVEKKKLIVPLVVGGIGTSLGMVALSVGWYHYYLNVVMIFLFFGIMYYGFLGSEAIEITEKGQNHVFLLASVTYELNEFIKFYQRKRQISLNRSGHYIYHLAVPDCWERQRLDLVYTPDEFEREGFIHASDARQVKETYHRYYAAMEMYLLCIDVRYLTAEVKYEMSRDNTESFPHLYGEINKEAIIELANIKSANDVTDQKMKFIYTYKEHS